MEIEEINEKVDMLNISPIRQYLKNNNKISLFESEKIELGDIDKIININKENLNNPLKIVVLGEVKAGKSTLINALIGKKVSYTNVVEATATILEIKYSKKDEIIIKQKNEEVINLYSLDELDNLMNDNRDNQEFFNKINKISVFTNTERLKEITLVDTPGLNTVTSENSERTEDYIANADVVLWILNSHHLGQRDVSEKIEEVLDYGKPIICVLNRIDEINGDISELVEYVEDEMGYMFSEIFTTSAKKAWDGHIEKNSSMVEESNINELYEYIINNIENNADQVQKESIMESMKVQIRRDSQIHKNIKLKLESMMESFNKDLGELNHFNNTIKQIVSNKLSEWIDTKFFETEKQCIINCPNDEEFMNLVKKYSSDEYIHNLINNQYEQLNNYIFDEWKNNTEQFLNKQKQDELETYSIINPYFVIKTENAESSNDVMEGIKQGGITAGSIGLGLAGYAAWLGPAAAYVSIGSAVSAFFPPLLIAGAIGGGIWKLVSKDKNKVNRYNQVDALVFEIKSNMKNKVVGSIKSNLFEASDYYYNNSELMIMSILQQCNTSKEEIEKLITELGRYIAVFEVNISNEINNICDKEAIVVYNAKSDIVDDIEKYDENDVDKVESDGIEYKSNISAAQISYLNGEWEEIYQLLKNENKSRPKVLSMLGTSCFFTARFEEAYKIYYKLFTGDSIYENELGCSLSEYDEYGRQLYNSLKGMKIHEFNLSDNLNKDYKQSIEKPDEQYPELDEYRLAVKLGQSKLGEFINRVESDMKSSDAEKRGWAYFNGAEIFFRNGDYDEAFLYYKDAISNVPSKALYYGYATQALMRIENREPVMALYSRRAVDLEPENARWHMLHALVCYRLGNRYDKNFFNTIKGELEKALSCCRKEQMSLRAAIEDLMEKLNIQNSGYSNPVETQEKYSDVKPKDISYEAVMNNAILIAKKNNNFLQFVRQIEEENLKILLENHYEKLKISNKLNSVHLGENGCIEFAGTLLLLTYSYAKNDTTAINACNEAIIMAFKGASPGIFSDVMDDIINEETNTQYEDWSEVYRYLKDNYGSWIRKIEFASDYTMSDHERYSKFINNLRK